MIVAGARCESLSGRDRAVVSANNGSVVASVPDGDHRDIERAVGIARDGFGMWRRTPTAERAHIMHDAAARVRDESESLAILMSREMGKPIRQSRAEAKNVADLIDYFAEEGLRVTGEIPKLDLPNELPLVVREPVGVVGAITPFNYPIALLTWKLGPALISGCTVVAKPDEHAPSAVLRLAEIFLSAGLPGSVFQVVTGGPETGRALVESRGINKIAFTGSVETGRTVASTAMSQNKRLTLELGGQCPAIVTAGAQLDAAVPAMVKHTFNNSGQYCYRINRIYVDKKIHAEFLERFVDAAANLVVAPGTEERSDVGPLCHRRIYERSMTHVSDATSRGAKVLLGGTRLEDGAYGDGYYLPPTIVDGCDHEMLLLREETFGPVVGVRAVDSLQEAIRYANDSIYGLAAYVFTPDLGSGLQAALQLEVGSVWVNGVKQAYPQCPFGGYKASGLGREKSHHGVLEYLELKSIYLQLPEIGNM
jgi:succinate-semialdehyde dehydrogenase / glutarate-semialdehyde dehydrogenase